MLTSHLLWATKITSQRIRGTKLWAWVLMGGMFWQPHGARMWGLTMRAQKASFSTPTKHLEYTRNMHSHCYPSRLRTITKKVCHQACMVRALWAALDRVWIKSGPQVRTSAKQECRWAQMKSSYINLRLKCCLLQEPSLLTPGLTISYPTVSRRWRSRDWAALVH